MRCRARVITKKGESVHLAEVDARNRPFGLDGLVTLCGYPVDSSMEGSSDACDCLACLKVEKEFPLERRSNEDKSIIYVPPHRRPTSRFKRVLKS